MFKQIASVVLLAAFALASCKKDKEKTTQEKILGKWNIASIVDNDFYSGASHINTYTGVSSDYLEFRSDGTVFVSFSGITNTSHYGLIGDTKIWIESDNYDIKTLTDNQFSLYSRDDFGADYYESTMNLRR